MADAEPRGQPGASHIVPDAQEALKQKLSDSIRWNAQYTLGDNNHTEWEMNAITFMNAKRVPQLLLPPSDPNAVTDKELQGIGKALLMQSVHPNYYSIVQSSATVYEAIQSLKNDRHGRSDNHLVRLMWQFLDLTLQKDENVRDMVARTRKIVQQLSELDQPVSGRLAAVSVLRACSGDPRFSHQVQHMIGTGMDLSLENVQAALMTCEQMANPSAPGALRLCRTS